MVRGAGVALVAASLCGPLSGGVARADRATEAGFHFRRGVALIKARMYERAVEAFFQASRLSPDNPATLYNIGWCLEQLGEVDDAFSYFSEFRALAVEERDRTDAAAALDRVLPRVARIEVASTPPGATIWLDRKDLGDVGATPRLFAAAPGRHTVFVEAPDDPAGFRSTR